MQRGDWKHVLEFCAFTPLLHSWFICVFSFPGDENSISVVPCLFSPQVALPSIWSQDCVLVRGNYRAEKRTQTARGLFGHNSILESLLEYPLDKEDTSRVKDHIHWSRGNFIRSSRSWQDRLWTLRRWGGRSFSVGLRRRNLQEHLGNKFST